MNKSPDTSVTLHQMTRNEVNLAIEWASKEGWNPGIHDSECFYSTDPTGFYSAKLNGEIVGTISLVKYPDDFVFEGLYIVKPEFRGRGIGRIMQNFALKLCKDKNLGLDGVMNMQQKYAEYGFKFSHNNVRYAGVNQNRQSERCSLIQKCDFNNIAAFDKECFGFDRAGFLECWLFKKDHVSMQILNEKGDVSGYGVIRRCHIGHKIGPLFANNAAIAEYLYDDLTVTANSKTVYLDIPQPNAAAIKLAAKKGLKAVFGTVRMYTKKAPEVPLEKIFGVSTFELA